MLDTVVGPKSDPAAIDLLLEQLNAVPLSGTIYVGYPLVILPDGAVAVDVLLTCREHGIILFDILRGAFRLPGGELVLRQRQLRQALEIALVRSRRLTVTGRLIVDVRVVTLDPDASPQPQVYSPPDTDVLGSSAPLRTAAGGPRYSARARPSEVQRPEMSRPSQPPATPGKDTGDVATWDTVLEVLRSATAIDAATLRYINAGVQRLGAVRPAPLAPGLGPLAGPRAAVLAEIDAQIANLDRWQKAAAIEMPEGPQRIRGLAGSGKTIVLAFKAAFLHAREPDWRIVLTFYTRTLYEPLRELVRRFFKEHTGKEPNWDRLRLQHAWGAKSRPGVYKQIAEHLGCQALGSSAAESKYGKRRVFESVCRELLSSMGPADPSPLYDAVLIDEAQDLPAAFLELAYRLTAPPKRIVWAYDDLQNITDYEPTSPAFLFGKGPDGQPRVPSLVHEEGEARTDIILPICYRNTPWALTTAHALGLGVYRVPPSTAMTTGLVQFYDSPELWGEIGYRVERGQIAPGEHVILSRDPANTPPYFKNLIDSNDAVQWFTFDDSEAEAEWIAREVLRNLTDDGLTPRQVLIVSANPFFKESEGIPLVRALTRYQIDIHVAGSGGRVDELFGTDNSIPISGINRAKGNEAAMVYVVHAERGAEPNMIVRRRNTLFSAVTRSKAWVRITGAGPGMRTIERELQQVASHDYSLNLTVPTPAQLKWMRKLQRDITSPLRRRGALRRTR